MEWRQSQTSLEGELHERPAAAPSGVRPRREEDRGRRSISGSWNLGTTFQHGCHDSRSNVHRSDPATQSRKVILGRLRSETGEPILMVATGDWLAACLNMPCDDR